MVMAEDSSENRVVVLALGTNVKNASWLNLNEFEKAGLEPILVSCGFEALEIIAEDGADLLVVSSNLDDMPGAQLCGLLKSNPSLGKLRIIQIVDKDRLNPSLSSPQSNSQSQSESPHTIRTGMSGTSIEPQLTGLTPGQNSLLSHLELSDLQIEETVLEESQFRLETLVSNFFAGLKESHSQDTWTKDESLSPAWKSLASKIELESNRYQRALDALLLERIVRSLIQELYEDRDPNASFIDNYFKGVSKLLRLDCLGVVVHNNTGAWLTFSVTDGLSSRSFNNMLEEITKESRINTEPVVERRGQLEDNDSKFLRKIDLVPVLRESGTKVSLVFGSCEEEPYDPATRTIVEELKVQLQPLFSLLLAKKEISTLQSQESNRASTDSLTGLYNLEFLIGFLQQQLLFSFRQRLPVGLAIIDIDGLAAINEKYGFENGDRIIAGIANKLLSITRSSDLIARYGGDEFAVVLPNTDITGARILGEKVRKEVEELDFKADSGESINSITVSVGCANFNMEDMNPETLLRDAKLALQKAKSEGRNSVSI